MQVDGKLFFRGLAPRYKSVVVIGPQADLTTLPHELAHTFGLGEFAADILGKLLAFKYQITKGTLLSEIRFKEVRYQLVDDLPPQFKGRVRHYIRV